MWGSALARDDERRRQQLQQQPEPPRHHQPQLHQVNHYAAQSYPPPPPQPPQAQQQQPPQSQSYYEDQEEYYGGDEDNGALSAGINMFASAASSIFTSGSAAAKQLANQSQKAASQIAAAAAPPPNQAPMGYHAHGQPPQQLQQGPPVYTATQQPQSLVPDTSMLSTPVTQQALFNQHTVSPSLNAPVLAQNNFHLQVQTHLGDEPPRRSYSPAVDFFAAPSPRQTETSLAPSPVAASQPMIPKLQMQVPAPTLASPQPQVVRMQVAHRPAPRSASPAAELFAAPSPQQTQTYFAPLLLAAQPIMPQLQVQVPSLSPAKPPDDPVPRNIPVPDPSLVAAQAFVGTPAVTQASSAPKAPAFLPPRSTPMSRFTPPSSPRASETISSEPSSPIITKNKLAPSGAAKRLHLPLPPRRQPLALPRPGPKLPSPRTSPSRVTKRWGGFKKPTPSKSSPPGAEIRPSTPILHPTPTSAISSPKSSPVTQVEPKVAAAATTPVSNDPHKPARVEEAVTLSPTPAPLPLSLQKPVVVVGWVEQTDPNTGKVYYFNSATNETSWGVPEKMESTESAQASPTPASPIVALEEKKEQIVVKEPIVESDAHETKDLLRDGWSNQQEPTTDNTHYVDSVTSKTYWEAPTLTSAALPVIPSEEKDASIPFEEVEILQQVVEGALEPAIEAIDESNDIAPESEVLRSPIAEPKIDMLPDGWTEVQDPNSGNIYYYSTTTQETRWERPPSAVLAPIGVPEVSGGAILVEEDRPASMNVEGSMSVCEIVEEIVDAVPASSKVEVPVAGPSLHSVIPEGSIDEPDPMNGHQYNDGTMTQETGRESPVRTVDSVAPPAANADLVPLKKGSTMALSEDSTDLEFDTVKLLVENLTESEKVDRPISEPLIGDTLPEGWTEVPDPHIENVYYHSITTKETSWERPALAVDSTITLDVSGYSPPVEEGLIIPVSEDVTGPVLSTIEILVADLAEPEVVSGSGTEPEVVSGSATDPLIGDKLPEGWTEVHDATTGSVYYYSTTTQEISWDRPALIIDSVSTLGVREEYLPIEENKPIPGCQDEDATELVLDTGKVPDEDLADPEVVNERVADPSVGDTLSEGWMEVHDAATDTVYYYNMITQETSWERPALIADSVSPLDKSGYFLPNEDESIAFDTDTDDPVLDTVEVPDADLAEAEREEGPISESFVGDALSEGWAEVHDATTGSVYYYNTTTQETSWEIPTLSVDSISPLGVSGESLPIEEDEEVIDKEVTADPVLDTVEVPGEDLAEVEVVDRSGNKAPRENVLPEGWTEVQDPDTDSVYYYNTATEESSWEIPTSVADSVALLDVSGDSLLAEEEDSIASIEDATEAVFDTVEIPDDDLPVVNGRLAEPSVGDTLSEGWVEVKDGSTGSVYYYNTVTQETSCEKPALIVNSISPLTVSGESLPIEEDTPVTVREVVTEVVLDTAVVLAEPEVVGAPVAESPIGNALPEHWTEVQDPNTSSVYYYNTMTQETNWDRPVLIVDSATALDARRASPQMEEDEPTDVCEVAAELVLDTVALPAEVPMEDLAESEVVDRPTAETSIVDSLPEGWIEAQDPNTSNAYYYNVMTQETSWERPELVVDSVLALNANGDSRAVEEDIGVSEDTAEPVINEAVKPANSAYGHDSAAAAVAAPTGSEPETEVAEEEYVILPGSQSLLAGWSSGVDPSSGRTFYYSGETGETTWDLPVAIPHSSAGEGLQSENRDDLADEDLQMKEYSQELSIEETPRASFDEEPESTANPDVDTATAGAKAEASLPDGRVEKLDPSTGQRLYYSHPSIENTSWDRPTKDQPDGGAQMQTEVSNELSGGVTAKKAAISLVEWDTTMDEPEIFPPQPTPTGDTLLSPWTEQIDLTTGKTYYYNSESQETTWSKLTSDVRERDRIPPIFVDGSSPEKTTEGVHGKSLPKGWMQEIDESSGRFLYYHKDNRVGTTSWERPHQCPDARVPETIQENDEKDELISEVSGTNENASVEGSPIEVRSPILEVTHLQKYKVDPKEYELRQAPGEYSALVDPPSGKTYYFNDTTDVKTWKAPEEAIISGVDDDPIETKENPRDNPAENATASSEGDGDPFPILPANIFTGDAVAVIEGEVQDNGTAPEKVSGIPNAEEICENPESIAEAEQQKGLLQGWTATVDATTGEYYYVNESTGETTWDRHISEPAEVPLVDKAPETAAPPVDSEVDVEPTSLELPEIGPLGASTEAHTASFERCEDNESIIAEMELREDWVEVVDPDSGGVYYYNEKTSETSWERPIVAAGNDSIVREDSTEVEVPLSEALVQDDVRNINQEEASIPEPENMLNLSPGWVECTDQGTGKAYFYNEESGTTSWEVPTTNDERCESKSNSPMKDTHKIYEDTDESKVAAADPIGNIKEELQTKIYGVGDLGNDGSLVEGWVEVTDSTSGNTYYVNKITKAISWDRPIPESVKTISGTKRSTPESRARSLQAFASFGFGGRLCIFRSKNPGRVELHKVHELVPSHPVARAEKAKHSFGIVGALNDAKNTSVSSYIAAQTSEDSSELLWSLIKIASQSEGRLRSDEGVADTSSPESSIIQILLQTVSSPEGDNGRREEFQKVFDESSKAESLERVESLLLHGKREEAVQEAIAGHHFAMALLVASMCDRATFQNVTKSFAEEILSSGSPLHTLALLFSGQLEPPPDSALDRSGLIPTVWSDTTDELRNSWKQHLCGVISNRMLGWDRIVLSLGDRLLELGEVHAAHCCYMVCGCPVASLLHPASRISIVGCDHLVPMDASLMTDESIAAYSRSEAYEWAKRRGNPDARIQSLQAFKLSYAMMLADLGYDAIAEGYIKSIRQCTGLEKKATDFDVNGKPATIWSLSESDELSRYIDVFDDRLTFRKNPRPNVGFLNGPAPSPVKLSVSPPSRQPNLNKSNGVSENEHVSSAPPIISIPDNQADADISMLSAKSAAFGSLTYAPAESAKDSDESGRNANPVSKESPFVSASFQTQPVLTSQTSAACKEATQMLSKVPDQLDSIGPGAQTRNMPSNDGGLQKAGASPSPAFSSACNQKGPKVARVASSMPPSTIIPPKMPLSIASMSPPKMPPVAASVPPTMPPTASTDPEKRDLFATPLPSEKKGPPKTAEKKQKKPERAPNSAPAELQSSKKTEAPTSAQKRDWGLGGFRDWMTKKMNPDATTATLGGGMEAYYDEKLKRWIFPGDDPAEVAKPLAPPPTALTPKKEPKEEEEKKAQLDPLAAMMAPPPRSVGRRPIGTTSRMRGNGFTPSMNMMMPPGASPMTPAATAGSAMPPSFMVFTPKAAADTKEEDKTAKENIEQEKES